MEAGSRVFQFFMPKGFPFPRWTTVRGFLSFFGPDLEEFLWGYSGSHLFSGNRSLSIPAPLSPVLFPHG